MNMLHKAAAVSALTLALAVAGSAQAVVFFQIDPDPGGAKLFLDLTKDASSSFGTVINTDDIAISVTGNSDFASGFSTIKPVKDGSLTDLLFTPVDPSIFTDFSFRGQDIAAGQTIKVIVTDNQGHAPETFIFTQGNSNQDFAREGIEALVAGETIKSVEIINSGGFEEAKQFEFSFPGGPVPEPATWAMMLLGFFGLGGVMRARRRAAIVSV